MGAACQLYTSAEIREGLVEPSSESSIPDRHEELGVELLVMQAEPMMESSVHWLDGLGGVARVAVRSLEPAPKMGSAARLGCPLRWPLAIGIAGKQCRSDNNELEWEKTGR